MRTVSENSEVDLAHQQALSQLDWKLRELTANLLRITRGAGKPYQIMQQMTDLAAAIQGFWDAKGLSPYGDEFARALDVSNDLETMQSWSNEDREREYAERRLIRGVLQVVASRLIGQKTQEAAGHNEMYDGLRSLEDLRAKERKAWTKPVTAHSMESPDSIKAIRSGLKAKRGRPRKLV